MRLEDIIIKENKKVAHDTYLLSFVSSDMAKEILPGQFLEIKVGEGLNNLLRLPISIHDVIDDTIYMLYKVIGNGTKDLTEYKTGAKISALGPLGNGFPKLEGEKEVLLVAGGIGYGPFPLVIRNNNNYKLFYGVSTKNEIAKDTTFKLENDKVNVATVDGSEGHKGFVTDILEEYILKNGEKDKIIFSCGPEIMMKKVAQIANKYNIESYLSLEEYMACGIGACVGCVKKIKNSEKKEGWEYKKVCKDGPIFKGDEVIWE
ncbi:dihydroorotate dehydrogenase electron transfer subunit [Haliovirga abyssi]|uniref:Dihydroorotate dehydrogenase B (NAD(+)), electron transfer subunit n=1 Tax=Haliovirga abyssi TaxID=2996794 RepID=A0AAU9E034_9FUSO|nr:dihydroorotate dehydrogenase electron transfer subunit [Haliovirga abyssi]BDU49650.1 dihydroorotate dehydrogenase B (NAD(+)), electron transfer subunit [Haliovirga abyssi]